jgi:hypothetical protein
MDPLDIGCSMGTVPRQESASNGSVGSKTSCGGTRNLVVAAHRMVVRGRHRRYKHDMVDLHRYFISLDGASAGFGQSRIRMQDHVEHGFRTSAGCTSCKSCPLIVARALK